MQDIPISGGYYGQMGGRSGEDQVEGIGKREESERVRAQAVGGGAKGRKDL
jgi:hypothetical protein